MNPDMIGGVAAVLTTISFAPQALSAIRTRNTAGISLLMYVLFTVGVAFWLTYGLMLRSPPLILANGVTLCLAGVILAMTAWNRLKGR